VLKSIASRDLVTAVNAVRSNKTFFTAKGRRWWMECIWDQAPKKEKPATRISKNALTPRHGDRAVLEEGKSSKEVAHNLVGA